MQIQLTPEELATEEWRPSSSFADVEVSSLGRVRVYPPIGSDGLGYSTVPIRRQNVRPHVLVAEAFHGDRPALAHVNHIDGVKTNNRALNLEWVTPARNIEHAYEAGLHKSRGGVTAAIALEVINSNEVDHVIAMRIGVSPSAIRDIRRGRTWTHVTGAPLQPPAHRRNRFTNVTHCIRGHLFDEANTFIAKGGGRYCRKCRALRARESKARLKQKT